jgi:hypothetical protein
MRHAPLAAYLLSATAAALLAGCSSGSQTAAIPGARPGTPMGAQSEVGNPNHLKLDTLAIAPQYRHSTTPFHRLLKAVVDMNPNSRTVFDSDPEGFSSSGPGFLESAPITSPPSGNINPFFFGVSNPGGILLVKKDLYVANTVASNVLVLESASVKRTLDDPGEFPSSVAVSRDGTLYAANIFNTSLAAGNISVYPKGSNSPTATLTSPTFFQVIGVAADGAGDVFANNNQSFFKGGQVIEFPGGTGTGTILKNIHVHIAGGLKIDPTTQDLLVVDQGNTTVKVYAPPYTGHAKASYPVPLGGSAVDVAFDATSSNLYFADVFGTIDVISYPAGAYLGSYTGGVEPIGVAVQPAPPL